LLRKGRLIPGRGLCRVSRAVACSGTGELPIPVCRVPFRLMTFGRRATLSERTDRYRYRSGLDDRHEGRRRLEQRAAPHRAWADTLSLPGPRRTVLRVAAAMACHESANPSRLRYRLGSRT